MPVTQLIYVSRPFGFDDAVLGGILLTARRNNARDGITGALICRHDIYLQMLEGDGQLIQAAFARIVPDDRHVEVVKLWSGEVAERLFPAWAMRDDPARSWMWTPAEVTSGAVRAASPQALLDVFKRLAESAPIPPLRH